MPGASAKEVEQRVTTPLERFLWEIPGVEYVYSTSSPGRARPSCASASARTRSARRSACRRSSAAHVDVIPPGATPPLVKPRSIDDVPVLAVTLWSKRY